jgi:hypothetical protein
MQMEDQAVETFEDAWDAKYAAEPADDTPVVEAAEEAAIPEEAPAPEAPEPAQASLNDTAQQAPDQPASPQADELTALRNKYEGTKARYQAEERKRKELEARLAEVEAKQNAPKSAPELDLDDLETGEIEAFRKAHPEIAKATVDNPRLAARWQKLLLERGEDEVIVTYETARGEASGAEQKVMQELQRRDAEAHLKAIEAQHPDWQDLIVNPVPQHEQDIYNPAFTGWVGMLPMNVGQSVVWALQNGTAEQVNTVLKAFKDYRANEQRAKTPPQRGNHTNAPPRSPQMQAAAKAAMAVPSKGAPPPKSRPGGDATFEELWEAKYR